MNSKSAAKISGMTLSRLAIFCAALCTLSFASDLAFAQSTRELEADLSAHPDHKSARTQLANIYVKQKQFDKAIALLNPYTDQLTVEGYLALGIAFSSKKDYVNESRVLGLLATKDDENFRWHVLLAQSHLKAASEQIDPEKKHELTTDAIQQLRRALQLQPAYKPAYDLLLITLMQSKAFNEAREMLMDGISRFGDRPELYRELCRLDSNDGYLVQAIGYCRMAIKLAPTYPDNYVYLVQSLYDQKEFQQAENDIVSAARRFTTSEFVQWAAGMMFFRKKNFAVAGRYFAAALKASPNSGRSHFGLAQSQFESGSENESLAHFIKACEADPSTIDTFLAAGGRLKQKPDFKMSKLGEVFVQKANTCRK